MYVATSKVMQLGSRQIHSSADPEPRWLPPKSMCALPSREHSTKSVSSVGCGTLAPLLAARLLWIPEFHLQNATKERADERTRTADLLQLRVINRTLQGFV
jgi:hypothetical protein